MGSRSTLRGFPEQEEEETRKNQVKLPKCPQTDSYLGARLGVDRSTAARESGRIQPRRGLQGNGEEGGG